MPKPRDRREFVFVDVNLPTHPKLAEVDSPLAGWLYVVGMCWSGRSLTDGHIAPKAVVREANVPLKWVKELVRVGAWHEPGHDCSRCAQPESGRLIIHDYLQHQRSRIEADAAREAGRVAAEKRWASRPDAKGNAKGIPQSSAKGTAGRNTEAEGEGESFLLTLISRLAAGTTRQPPPAEVISSWQEHAGPGIDLETEARAYLARYGDRPADDERGAWLGWLRKAQPAATEAEPLGCAECLGGWLPDDIETGRPVPCRVCRPHLRGVAS